MIFSCNALVLFLLMCIYTLKYIHLHSLTYTLNVLTLLAMKALDLFFSKRSTDLLHPFQAASCNAVLPYYKII